MFITREKYLEMRNRIGYLEGVAHALEEQINMRDELIKKQNTMLDEEKQMLKKMSDKMKTLLVLLPEDILSENMKEKFKIED